jgi:alpha-beta hydrolase superfamily lysophospholipase
MTARWGWRGGAALAAFVVGLVCLVPPAPAPALADRGSTVSIPVAFSVRNTNTSNVPCVADGATYSVRGHLSGPRSMMTAPPDSVTVYLHGLDAGEWNWTFDAVPGYDYADELAADGHVSLTLDELGYGRSGHPADGNGACVGAEADVVHQIVQQLRAGRYTVDRPRVPKFGRVVVAGHDAGGLIAEIETSSYRDVDALVEVTWADQGHSQFIVERSATASTQWCTVGDGASPHPASYVHYATEDDWRTWVFHDADPAVIAATDTRRNANPCGVIRSLAPAAVIENPYSLKAAAGLDPGNAPVSPLASVTVPVLVVFGAEDTQLWSRQGEDEQAGNFSGSHDRTTVYVPGAAHFPMFEKTAPEFREVMSSWLRSHHA